VAVASVVGRPAPGILQVGAIDLDRRSKIFGSSGQGRVRAIVALLRLRGAQAREEAQAIAARITGQLAGLARRMPWMKRLPTDSRLLGGSWRRRLVRQGQPGAPTLARPSRNATTVGQPRYSRADVSVRCDRAGAIENLAQT
jgi:hypothetical protein